MNPDPVALDVTGKVAVLTGEFDDGDGTPLQQMDRVTRGLLQAGAKLVICLPAGFALWALGDEDMQREGWTRTPQATGCEEALQRVRAVCTATLGDTVPVALVMAAIHGTGP